MLLLNAIELYVVILMGTAIFVNGVQFYTMVVQPNETICLVCPVVRGSVADKVSWKLGDDVIVRHDAPVRELAMEVNKCNTSNYSLEIFTTQMSLREQTFFSCLNYSTPKATFRIDVPDLATQMSIRSAILTTRVSTTLPTLKSQPDLIPFYVLIPILFIVSISTSLFLYYRIQGRRKVTLHIPSPPAQDNPRNVDDTVDTTDHLVYDDLDDEEKERNQKPKESTCKATTKTDYETSLVVCLKTSGMFEYWSATYNREEEIDVKCFAKTLSGSATMNDARSFQNLAMELNSLQKHSCIVRLLCISVDELPYSIFYEQLECGSLRDFMMSQYQGARDTIKASVSNSKQDFLQGKMKAELQQLMYFASNITKGMSFLSGQKFCHPALCLKKVLLSNNGQCKLYDICPLTMAMKKVEDLMKKSRPPIAWMAPETVFMQEYFQSSDTWGYAVLLWELFSFGEVPFARASTTDIEQKLREGFMMAQPLRCPGAVYGIMLSCWNNRKRERPNFSSISNKLKDMARKLEQRSPPNTPSAAGAYHSRKEFVEEAVTNGQGSYFVLEAELPGNEYV